jgi:ligand-binding SRPBCC domain-containing protein
MAPTYRLERSQLIARPRSEVFAFFSAAENLEAITPDFLRFRIVTPLPIEMREGTRIDYSLSLWGLPLRWRTKITSWQPDVRFIDEQESGPYALWRHLHAFDTFASGTRMRDRVDYQLPMCPLGSIAHTLLVRRSLHAIFDYRRRAIASRFEALSGS